MTTGRNHTRHIYIPQRETNYQNAFTQSSVRPLFMLLVAVMYSVYQFKVVQSKFEQHSVERPLPRYHG
jgi:hypothetical protein